MNRQLDALLAAALLLLAMPVMALSGLAVLVESGRPILFRQRRVGRNFEPFEVLKFRTMRSLPGRAADGVFGPHGEITRVGGVLRRSKLDELPQLLNVLRGEMRLVGPRPEVERYVDLFRDEFAPLLSDAPGIVDPASLAYADEEQLLASSEDPSVTYVTMVLPDKLERSRAYREKRTTSSDVRILVRAALRPLGVVGGARR